ncbi:MAG: GNAT family N-acetyltransferase [Eubacteriaceae bacterium]|nr:GNAT family N-acetyltransferase [Eubacteriaceae bacterium]
MKKRLLNANEYKSWYENHLCEDFPLNEVKPLDDIMDLNEAGNYKVIVYEEDRALMGYCTIWKYKGSRAYLMDYFAVPADLRNRGVGKDILKRISSDVAELENNPDICIILESETPFPDDESEENVLRKRRLKFYQRNGWVKMYEMATCGMRFNAMSFEKIPENPEMIMKEHKKIYGEKRTDVIVPLPEGEIPPLPYWMK